MTRLSRFYSNIKAGQPSRSFPSTLFCFALPLNSMLHYKGWNTAFSTSNAYYFSQILYWFSFLLQLYFASLYRWRRFAFLLLQPFLCFTFLWQQYLLSFCSKRLICLSEQCSMYMERQTINIAIATRIEIWWLKVPFLTVNQNH